MASVIVTSRFARTTRSLTLAVAATLAAATLPATALFAQDAGLQKVQFAPGGGQRAPASFADIVDRVKPSVVSIYVTGGKAPQTAQNQQAPGQTPRGQQQQPRRMPDNIPEEYRKFFEDFFGRGNPGAPGQGSPSPLPSLAQGSGFVISEDGYVVTNNHVVENGSKIQISFDANDKLEAELIGTDARTDIALLKIKSNGRKFPAVKFAAKEPRVGDWVLAVGNPFGFGGTVTAGIVSALSRDVGGALNDFLQIDAAVNRGNSGGPTFNLEGDVVGVNTAIYSPSGGNVGIAFAVPSKTVTEVIAQLRSSGSVSRGWLGVKIQNVDEDTAQALGMTEAKGAVINEVTTGGPAAAAGLKNGDTILAINGAKVADSRDLARKVAAFAPDASIDVRVLRGGKEQSVAVKLGDFKNASGAPVAPAKAEAPKGAAPKNIELAGLGMALAPAGSPATKNIKEGVVIADVTAGSDAAQKGIRAGDVILEVSSVPVTAAGDVSKAMEEAEKLGRKAVLMRIKSGEAARFVAVQLKKS